MCTEVHLQESSSRKIADKLSSMEQQQTRRAEKGEGNSKENVQKRHRRHLIPLV
jgi:hypothetical protein